MVNKEQEYVDIEMVKEGHYYIIKLIDSKGTRYSIAMFSNKGEALHAIEIERRKNLDTQVSELCIKLQKAWIKGKS